MINPDREFSSESPKVYETEQNRALLDADFKVLLDNEPKPIFNFVPTNAEEQKELFLNDEIRNPELEYGRLATLDLEVQRVNILEQKAKILENPAVAEKYKDVYSQFADRFVMVTDLMTLVQHYNTSTDFEEKEAIKQEHMRLNIELYGEPDEVDYRSLLGEKIQNIMNKELSLEGEKIREELLELLDGVKLGNANDRYKPSNVTFEWVKNIVHALYDGLLQHVPERPEEEEFNDQEIKSIFEEIILEEFGQEYADQWSVVIEEASTINVKASERRIVIPQGKTLTYKELRGRVVHELGVHFLRSVMGEMTDLEVLRVGMSEYYDAEEGQATVVEMALHDEYREAGDGHYITAGLAYYEGKDYRDITEIKTRIALLESDTIDLNSPEQHRKTKGAAYANTLRIFRGGLLFFKDLSYRHGSVGVWKDFESILGDEFAFHLRMLGKSNAAKDEHRRIILETATV